MPRAHRFHLPGFVWHITHRCHQREFLLKFQRDRTNWQHWLYQAKRRYNLRVLNYVVTSNHIHLLVEDRGVGEIAQSMRLIAGRTAQAYNRRKGRKGAFWEDRYHATAIESGAHLARCLIYIDLNMVRAGVVQHPSRWPAGGYHEIQTAREHYRILDREALARLLAIDTTDLLAKHHTQWLEHTLQSTPNQRDERWSKAIAVGSKSFVQDFQNQLGIRALDRTIHISDDFAHISEEPGTYARTTTAKRGI